MVSLFEVVLVGRLSGVEAAILFGPLYEGAEFIDLGLGDPNGTAPAPELNRMNDAVLNSLADCMNRKTAPGRNILNFNDLFHFRLNVAS